MRSVRFDGLDVPITVAELEADEAAGVWSLTAALKADLDMTDMEQPPELVMIAMDGARYRGPALLTGLRTGSSGITARWQGAGGLIREPQ